MTKRPNLTPTEQERIAELREGKGYSYARIATIIGCSVGSVEWCCLKLAIVKPNAQAQKPPQPVTRMRGGRPVRMFTADEDSILEAMSQAGTSHAEIGRKLNRSPNSIAGRLFTLARRQELAERT